MTEYASSHPDVAIRLKRQKLALLGLMLFLSGLFGVLDSVYASTPGWEKTMDIVAPFSFSICLSLWCGCDAQLLGIRLSRGLNLTIILLALIGFPIYAFKSRGWRGWFLLGAAVLFMVLLMLLYGGLGFITDVVTGE